MSSQLRKILEMIRFSHTLFAMPFAMLAAVMAWSVERPDGGIVPFRWRDLLGIALCMVFARSAAMAFNRIVDRRLDADNPRTANRHLPSGSLPLRSVVIFTVVNVVGFLSATLLFLPNRLPLILAVPVLLFLLAYSLTKRFTALAHFWLGASLMLAPIAAWIAIRGEVLWQDPGDMLPAVLLGAAVLLWVAGFDIIYACQDVQYDRQAKLHSIPARLGVRGSLRLAAGCHAAMIGTLAALPLVCQQVGFGAIYGGGITAVAVLLLYEHWLVRPDDLTRVNIAFFHVNSIISMGLFLIGAADLFF